MKNNMNIVSTETNKKTEDYVTPLNKSIGRQNIFINNARYLKHLNKNKFSSVTSAQVKKFDSSVSMMNSVFVKGWVDKAEFITKEEFFKRLKK